MGIGGPAFSLLIGFGLLTSSPSQAGDGCWKETRVIEGRALDVYVCEGLEVSLSAYAISLSNCVPGMASCLGQIYYPVLSGEQVDFSYPLTGPIVYPSHLAYFPFGYCDPGFPIEVLRDPAVRGERGEEIRIPVEEMRFSNPRLMATGMTNNPSPPIDCYFLRGLSLEEILSSREGIGRDIGNIVRFVVHDVAEVSQEPPIRRITAYYGYSINYFDGFRFHEGMDTSWLGVTDENLLLGASSIWTPIPVMPVIVKPGWTLGMMPCGVADRVSSAMLPYPQGGYALREAFKELEEGRASPDRDCAVLFGGLHVYANAINSIPRRVAEMVSSGACAGRLPIECALDLYVPAGGLMVPCAREPGYAGAVAPHCHYQAVALNGDQARALLRIMKQSPSAIVADPYRLDHYKTDWGEISYIEWIYSKSFDPLMLIFPELAPSLASDIRSGFAEWARHGIPSVVASISPAPELFVGWYQALGEFYPGMPDYTALAQAGIEPSGQGTICQVAGKQIPGWGCKPSISYYNSAILLGPQDRVFQSLRLSNALRSALQVRMALSSLQSGGR